MNKKNADIFCLDQDYSTSQKLTKTKPEIKSQSKALFQPLLFLPKGKERKGEGGLRTKGYFKQNLSNNPLITIVTVVFNGEKYLERTIESVINQRYDNVEYIIIDGASSDKTVDIIKKYEDKIDYWVSEEDNGIYDAMNKGIRLASGESIGILNCADFYMPDTIEKVVECNGFSQNTLISGNMLRYVENKGNEVKFTNHPPKDALDNYLKIMPLNHPSTFVGRGVYNKLGLFDTKYKICADYEFVVRAKESNIKFIILDDVLAKMQIGGVSDKINSLYSRAKEHFLIRRKYKVSLLRNVKETAKYFLRHSFKSSLKLFIPKSILMYRYSLKGN